MQAPAAHPAAGPPDRLVPVIPVAIAAAGAAAIALRRRHYLKGTLQPRRRGRQARRR